MPKNEQGVNKNRYHVIPRTLIFVFHEDTVLLIKGNKSKNLWAEKYNGLGGHVEAGEDVLESAYRELWEESGQKGVHLQLCGTVMCDVEPHMGVAMFVFKGEYQHEPLISSEEGSLEWVKLSAITDINVVADLRVLIPQAYKWQPVQGVIFALNAYDEKENLITKFYKQS